MKTANIIAEPVQKMNGILRRKLSLLNEALYLSEQAYNYIDEDNIEPLNNLIESKQELTREIDHYDRLFLFEFDKLKSDLGISSINELGTIDELGLKELKQNTEKILELLKKIEALDAKFNQGIAKLRNDIAADLVRITCQKQISGMYSSDAVKRLYPNDGAQYIFPDSQSKRKKRDKVDYSHKSSFDTKK